jgi:hypothetical protein
MKLIFQSESLIYWQQELLPEQMEDKEAEALRNHTKIFFNRKAISVMKQKENRGSPQRAITYLHIPVLCIACLS